MLIVTENATGEVEDEFKILKSVVYISKFVIFTENININ